MSRVTDGLVYLTRKHSLSVALIVIMGSGLILSNLYFLSSKLNKSTAIQNAKIFSEAITRFRTLYTSEVVSRVSAKGVEVRHDYEQKKGAISLPATLTIKLGRNIGFGSTGTQVRLYSDFPFPSRKDGGPQDEFERSALNFLRQNPNGHYFRFEEVDNRWSLRYATADRMRAKCISCHNHHPQSPKTDWKIGEVRGVLEVVLPFDNIKDNFRQGLLGSFLFMATITFMGLVLLALVIGGLHRSTTEAQILARKTKKINLSLQEEIFERSKIESTLADRSAELEAMNKKLQVEIQDRKKALVASESIRKELEEFNKVAVGRELKMLEMKKQINDLYQELGKDKLYDIDG